MAADQVNKWLTLTANFAVVAGIVFLVVELKQNNELLLSESRQAAMSNDQTALLVGLDNVDIFEKWLRPEELSPTATEIKESAGSSRSLMVDAIETGRVV